MNFPNISGLGYVINHLLYYYYMLKCLSRSLGSVFKKITKKEKMVSVKWP